MKSQRPVSVKNKKNIISLLYAESAQKVVKVNAKPLSYCRFINRFIAFAVIGLNNRIFYFL